MMKHSYLLLFFFFYFHKLFIYFIQINRRVAAADIARAVSTNRVRTARVTFEQYELEYAGTS